MLKQLVGQLCEIADSPQKSILLSMEKTGKRAVGLVEPYGPEEIVYAAGCLPVGLWGGQMEATLSRSYLPAFACSIMQSVMELQLNGVYDQVLSAAIVPAVCDTLKCIGQKWKAKCPAIHFVHPQNRKLESSVMFLAEEYRILTHKLEQILQVEITEEALQESIQLYNVYRQTMREFTDLLALHPQRIDPASRHKILKAGYFMDKMEYTGLIKKLIDELKEEPVEAWTGKRVVVTGLTLEPEELLEIFGELKLAIVADDLAHESRQFRTDVPQGESALVSLARQWQNHSGCSFAFDPGKGRIQHILDLLEKYRADGLVIALMKFCDPEEYDVPIIMEECRKKNIPLIRIEIDQQESSFEQVRTRLQSFAESIGNLQMV